MSKTWYGHYIYADLVKGQEFVDFKEYLELDKIIKSKEEEIKSLQGSLQTYEIILKTNLEAYTKENYKQRQIINHLSRKIQNKNKKYKQLQARKMPPTFMGREVIVMPDSVCKEIMVMDKHAFEYATKVVNDFERKQ